MRILLAAVIVAATAAFPNESMAFPGDPTTTQETILRDAVTVSDSLVRLGDLFVNAGDNADVEVAYAPAAGKRLVLDAYRLYRIARTHGLDWRPMSKHDRAIVKRESIIVGGDEIKERILASLPNYGIDPDTVVVDLNNPMVKMHLPAELDTTIMVEDLTYTPGNGRFAAVIAAQNEDQVAQRLRVMGRLRKVARVPVLSRRVLRGEVIDNRDVRWQRVRSSRLPSDVILEPEDLAGFSPKRTLRAGTPIRVAEVQPPVVVSKGALVTLVLDTPSMTLTARGRALEDGGDGDTIRVTNAQSRTTVQGVVTGAGKVAVPYSGPVIVD
jgi:flagella basal body P-ring formation protein FlgA